MNDLEKIATTPSAFYTRYENPEEFEDIEEPIKISEVLGGIHPKYSGDIIIIDGDSMIIRLPLKEKLIYTH